MSYAYVSNQIEELLEILLEQLDQLGRAYVLVPSQAMKGWLEQALCSKRAQGTLGVKISTSSIKPEDILKVLLTVSKKSDMYPTLAQAAYGIGSEYLVEPIPALPSNEEHLFLFGWSSLCPAYISHLKKLEQCTLLLFSPCMLFWSDVLSSSEESYLMRRLDRFSVSIPIRERLEELLADKNPFLANSGVLARSLLTSLEDVGITCSEKYVLSDALSKMLPYQDLIREETLVKTVPSQRALPTFLERVQADMLMLISEKEQNDLCADQSIQVIKSATRYGEVQAVRHAFENHFQGREVLPGSVYILAHDIQDYKGAIGRVFGTGLNPIPYQIIEEWSFEHDQIVKQFFMLLQLPHMRLDLAQIEELIECKAVQLALNLQREDVGALLSRLKRSGFRFGLNKQHAKQVLTDEGFHVKTADMGHTVSDVLQEIWEQGISNDETDLLARLIYYLEAVKKSLNAVEESVCGWLKICRDLFAFAFQDDGSKSYEELWKLLYIDAPIQDMLSYERFLTIFREVVRIHFEKTSHVHIWAPVVCTSLKGTPPPAEVVAIVGQELNSYPNEEISSQWPFFDQYSKRAVFDSSLLGKKSFLDAVFAARSMLILTHRNYSFERRSMVQPSILLTEFTSSITQRYGEKAVETCTTVWPFVRYAEKANSNYISAIFEQRQESDCGKFVDILVDDFLRFGKNPILESLKRRFGLQFDWEESDDLLLPRQGVIQEIRSKLELKALYNRKSYAGYLSDLFKEEIGHIEVLSQKMGTQNSEPILVSLSSAIENGHFENGNLTIPAYINKEKSHRISGQAPSLQPSAHLFYSSDFDAEKIRRWPEVLLRAYIQKKSPAPISLRLVSILNQDEQIINNIDFESALEGWIDYYKACTQQCIPLNSKIVTDVFKNKLTRESLLNHLQEEGRVQYSEAAAEYILDSAQTISLDELQAWAERLYPGVYR